MIRCFYYKGSFQSLICVCKCGLTPDLHPLSIHRQRNGNCKTVFEENPDFDEEQ